MQLSPKGDADSILWTVMARQSCIQFQTEVDLQLSPKGASQSDEHIPFNRSSRRFQRIGKDFLIPRFPDAPSFKRIAA
jgi:hypothetical protein